MQHESVSVCGSPTASQPLLPFPWPIPPLEKSKFSRFWSPREVKEQCLWEPWCGRVSNPVAARMHVVSVKLSCVLWEELCIYQNGMVQVGLSRSKWLLYVLGSFMFESIKLLMLSDMWRAVVCIVVKSQKSFSVLFYPFWTRSWCVAGPIFFFCFGDAVEWNKSPDFKTMWFLTGN